MMASIVGGWFIFLTAIIGLGYVRSHIASVQHYLNKIMGGLLAFLGIKILLSAK